MNPTDFQLLILKLSNDPNRHWLYLTEAALLLSMFAARVWGLPRQQSLAGRIWFRSWTLFVYVGLAAYVAPRLWLGPDVDPVLKTWVLGSSMVQAEAQRGQQHSGEKRMSNEELKRKLSATQYRVACEGGTEPPPERDGPRSLVPSRIPRSFKSRTRATEWFARKSGAKPEMRIWDMSSMMAHARREASGTASIQLRSGSFTGTN